MKKILIISIISIFAISISQVLAQMSSANYQIGWDSINSGGDDFASSSNYSLNDTLGQITSGRSNSANYKLYSGYRLPEQGELLALEIGAQDNTSQVNWTNFNEAGLSVIVSATSSYAIGDYIAIIENEGDDQLVSIGKITSITGSSFFVDQWQGNASTTSAVAGGGDDFVYNLSTNHIDFGLLNVGIVKTGVSFAEVSTTADNGYRLYVKENHNLLSTSTLPNPEINDVSDSDISAGSEEYGIKTVGEDIQNINDWALTNNNQDMSIKTVKGQEARTGIIYKAAISPQTPAGSYMHTVSYYCTANF